MSNMLLQIAATYIWSLINVKISQIIHADLMRNLVSCWYCPRIGIINVKNGRSLIAVMNGIMLFICTDSGDARFCFLSEASQSIKPAPDGPRCDDVDHLWEHSQRAARHASRESTSNTSLRAFSTSCETCLTWVNVKHVANRQVLRKIWARNAFT